MKIKCSRLFITVICFCAMTFTSLAQSSGEKHFTNAGFSIRAEKYGISEISNPADKFPTNYIRKGKLFGEVTIRYSYNKKLDSVRASSAGETTVLQQGKMVSNFTSPVKPGVPLKLAQSFSLNEGDSSLTWLIKLANTGESVLRIDDLVLPFFYNMGGGENPKEIFEERVIKHHFISGNNSFIFWQRPTGVGPYLLMVPLPGSSFEYFSTVSTIPAERGVFQAFIHSALTGNKETRGTWRQRHSAVSIETKSSKTYGFKFRWAKDYKAIRNILVEEGLIDVQVMPGMSIPNDLEAMIALRTKQKIDTLLAEFAPATKITYEGEKQKGTYLYKIKFSHLGENKLTIRYGNGYKTYLEFFVTEPLETLYKKRAAFIVNSQQHKDSTSWYNGLFGVYDMKNAELRGPDNPDYFDTSRLSYVLTCDDPGLCKAPFLAAKNVFFPEQKEIDAIEYYIKNFVWGGLQRTDKETPYAYGVYGTPSWLVNRDTVRRKNNTADQNRDKMHVWRSYDYPHIFMLYYHMYQVAKMYPGMTRYLDKSGYLERAKETAIAYFKYPYEILPWYETYKWGCYNELVLTDLIADLQKEGFTKDAAFLTSEWEKKVKYFLYDDPYPFRSEYAIDATAFESSHALAAYAVQHKMQPDSNLWYDKNVKRWYSHPQIKETDGINFMERQLQANIALRGAVEPAYYYLGSDFRGKSDSYTLSYMSQMGGWSILDYALHYSNDPADYIRLGYQSYLSSFALINSGTPETNYGYWYPGKENDGASGWAFEPQKYANPWIQKQQGRGPWFYDGEIDLGFGGATRMAATVVTNDPVFGMVAYGGDLVKKNGTLNVVPKDGLRRRFFFRDGTNKIDIELNRDGFAKGTTVVLGAKGNLVKFDLENRTSDTHVVNITLAGLKGSYTVTVNGIQQKKTFVADAPSVIPIMMKKSGFTKISMHKL